MGLKKNKRNNIGSQNKKWRGVETNSEEENYYRNYWKGERESGMEQLEKGFSF